MVNEFKFSKVDGNFLFKTSNIPELIEDMIAPTNLFRSRSLSFPFFVPNKKVIRITMSEKINTADINVVIHIIFITSLHQLHNRKYPSKNNTFVPITV